LSNETQSTQEFYTLLTNIGIEALIKAKANNKDIKLSKMAVSDNESKPNQDMTILEDEKYKFDINSIFVDEVNPHHLIIEGVIPASIGGFYVCQIGIYTDDNVLFAVGKVPKTYKPLIEQGASKDLTIKVVLEISNSANVTLKIDDGVVLATKEFLKSELKKTMQDLKDSIASKLVPVGVVSAFVGEIPPQGYLIADGSLLKREHYPALWNFALNSGNIVSEEIRQQERRWGGFTFGDDETTFRIPHLRGFLRMDHKRELGSFQGDSIRNITGHTGLLSYRAFGHYSGAFYTINDPSNHNSSQYAKKDCYNLYFDASKVVPTADENRPINVNINYIIKY